MSEKFKLTTEATQVTAHERLYLAADGKTVVREGDKSAATLLAAAGQPIPIKRAIALGLVSDAEAPNARGTTPESRETRPLKAPHTR